MAGRASIRRLAGNRLHLQDGPIDLIVEAAGAPAEVESAYTAAARRFVSVLDELCAELPLLRQQVTADSARPAGVVAARMWRAVLPFAASAFITPMAAVAGAVSEEILAAMTDTADLRRAYVNNGGDIALFLSMGETFDVGLVDRPDRPRLFGTLHLKSSDRARGVATSGWRGRSFSLGVADAVTVLARTAAEADAAATIIANAVDLPGHPAIVRRPAHGLDPQSDLRSRLVTVDVGPLGEGEVDSALAAGRAAAQRCLDADLIGAAALHLAGKTQQIGLPLRDRVAA